MVEAGPLFPRGNADVRAIHVSPLDAGLLDATVRLTRLQDKPGLTGCIAAMSRYACGRGIDPEHAMLFIHITVTDLECVPFVRVYFKAE